MRTVGSESLSKGGNRRDRGVQMCGKLGRDRVEGALGGGNRLEEAVLVFDIAGGIIEK